MLIPQSIIKIERCLGISSPCPEFCASFLIVFLHARNSYFHRIIANTCSCYLHEWINLVMDLALFNSCLYWMNDQQHPPHHQFLGVLLLECFFEMLKSSESSSFQLVCNTFFLSSPQLSAKWTTNDNNVTHHVISMSYMKCTKADSTVAD